MRLVNVQTSMVLATLFHILVFTCHRYCLNTIIEDSMRSSIQGNIIQRRHDWHVTNKLLRHGQTSCKDMINKGNVRTPERITKGANMQMTPSRRQSATNTKQTKKPYSCHLHFDSCNEKIKRHATGYWKPQKTIICDHCMQQQECNQLLTASREDRQISGLRAFANEDTQHNSCM